jgi:hypothetical protein
MLYLVLYESSKRGTHCVHVKARKTKKKTNRKDVCGLFFSQKKENNK